MAAGPRMARTRHRRQWDRGVAESRCLWQLDWSIGTRGELGGRPGKIKRPPARSRMLRVVRPWMTGRCNKRSRPAVGMGMAESRCLWQLDWSIEFFPAVEWLPQRFLSSSIHDPSGSWVPQRESGNCLPRRRPRSKKPNAQAVPGFISEQEAPVFLGEQAAHSPRAWRRAIHQTPAENTPATGALHQHWALFFGLHHCPASSSGLPSSPAHYPGLTVVGPAAVIPATPSESIVLPAPGTSAAANGVAEVTHRRSTVTPPAAISPTAMMTPDPEKIYSHDPSLPEEIVPNEELRFESREEAYSFYCYYASKAGFDVRITKTHPTVGEFSCNKQGKWEFYKPGEERKTEKTSKRTTCRAFVKAKWNKKNGYWFFERIRMEHNHILTPSEEAVKFMNAHKNRDPVIMEMVDQWHRNNVPPNCTVNLLSDMYGGRQNISSTEMDLKNRRAAAAREERRNDIPKLLEFFKEMRAHSEHFYYEVQVDEENVIQNVFWSHASQRVEYVDFGDVVTFDTTYRTNIYSMPLAMFVGSNHQLQNVIFGQALLHNKQSDTFEWLFKPFQNCMRPEKDPRCILTDQDSSMAAAIIRVFSKTIHRLCRWHMLKKYKEELKKLYSAHEGLKEKLHTVINHPQTPVEFEAAWNALVDEYGIRENFAIDGLWKQRELWIPAYFKQYYCGRMTSTQRSKSVNKMVKGSGFATHMTSVNKFA